jgi:hypothetical protein
MAVTGTDQKVDGQLRSEFDTSMNSSDYATAVGGAQQTTVHHGTALGDGHIGSWDENVDSEMQGPARGIKEEFKTQMDAAIEKYTGTTEGIQQRINQLETETTTIIAGGFKGTNVESAVARLIRSLKAEADAFTAALKAAEEQIIDQVAAAYAKQDEALANTMNADTSNMSNAVGQ